MKCRDYFLLNNPGVPASFRRNIPTISYSFRSDRTTKAQIF